MFVYFTSSTNLCDIYFKKTKYCRMKLLGFIFLWCMMSDALGTADEETGMLNAGLDQIFSLPAAELVQFF